eukprot:6621529-Pyramimonas_sp.AAC.1
MPLAQWATPGSIRGLAESRRAKAHLPAEHIEKVPGVPRDGRAIAVMGSGLLFAAISGSSWSRSRDCLPRRVRHREFPRVRFRRIQDPSSDVDQPHDASKPRAGRRREEIPGAKEATEGLVRGRPQPPPMPEEVESSS